MNTLCGTFSQSHACRSGI